MTSLKKQSFLSGHTQSCVFLATTIDNGNSLQAISFLLCIWLRRNSFRLHLIKCKCCIIYERKLNFIKLIPQEAVHVKKKNQFLISFKNQNNFPPKPTFTGNYYRSLETAELHKNEKGKKINQGYIF